MSKFPLVDTIVCNVISSHTTLVAAAGAAGYAAKGVIHVFPEILLRFLFIISFATHTT